MLAERLSVGEVAKRSKLAVSAIHYYEAQGLIHSIRNSGNQRRFSRDVLRRLAIISAARNLGIPLKTIKVALLTLPQNKTPSLKDWERLSHNWQEELQKRIDRLTTLKNTLDSCIGCGCLSLDKCQLFNKDDHFANSPQAHRLTE